MRDDFFRTFRQKLIKYCFLAFAGALGIGILSWIVLEGATEYMQESGFRAAFFGPDGFNEQFQIFFVLFIAAIIFAALLFIQLRADLQYIDEIMESVRDVAEHGTRREILVRGNDEFSELASVLNQLQANIEESREREQRAENAKNDLVSSVAHDLRTPLTSILGYLDWVQTREMDEETRKHYINIAYEKARYLQRLINELFGYIKLEHQSMPVHIARLQMGLLLEQMIDEMYPAFEDADLTVTYDNQAGTMPLEADGELMARLFENLLNNAIKYGKEGKEVKISTQIISKVAIIRVINYGKIISQEDQENLFRKFYRGEQSRSRETGGTGLGLAIVKQIAELHHGTVSVRSDLHGTVFEVELPLEQPKKKEEGQP